MLPTVLNSLWIACSVGTTPASPTGPPQGANDVVATWKGGEISRAELETAAEGELRALDIEQKLARYELLRRVVERQVDAALLTAEAAKRGSTPEELLAGVEDVADAGSLERALRMRSFRQELRREADVRVTVPYPDLPTLDVPVSAEDPSVGPSEAPLRIVAFGGYQCMYCREVEKTLHRIRAEWPDDVAVVYKDFPLPGHPQAVVAAVAAQCANEQGHFAALHELLLNNQSALGDADIQRYALSVGVEAEAFDACRASGRHEAGVARDVALGQQLGVVSTPTLFVDGVLVAGAQPYEVFAGLVSRRLSVSTGVQ